MHEFKVGDKVRRTAGNFRAIHVGDTGTVTNVSVDTHILKLQGYIGTFLAEYFELVEEEDNCGFSKDE